ncbi:hypothetical protein HDE69_000036 [Pedobacter cryoconitis]|uniref:Uncharacterized protein n=1 Tax=Pedobacter cryoconitis TaxID=188932 RepID=A0A7W9DIE5_9SPHI|nr:hypothetical protein [Pedobacter cryoconitis]
MIYRRLIGEQGRSWNLPLEKSHEFGYYEDYIIAFGGSRR